MEAHPWPVRWRSAWCRRSLSRLRVAFRPPAGDQRGVLACIVLPSEVASVDDVELAVRESCVEKLRVRGRNHSVAFAGDDLYRRLDRRQQVAEDREFGGVGTHVAHGLDEALAVVGGQIVLTDP